MIFPGRDPFLERPVLWTGVHASMIVYIRDYLQPLLRPRFVGAIEERVFLEEMHESFINILDLSSKQNVVTVIEVVSPINKCNGPGRASYLAKQKEVQQSTAHLVEIDLLRTGFHVLAVPEKAFQAQGPYHYLACVNRGKGLRDEFELYPRKLPEKLPKICIPLTGDESDVILDLQAVLEQTYQDGCYDDRIDYNLPCRPSLTGEDLAWANRILRKAGYRPAP